MIMNSQTIFPVILQIPVAEDSEGIDVLTYSSLKSQQQQINIALIGGLRANENIGRNVLVRLARHLSQG